MTKYYSIDTTLKVDGKYLTTIYAAQWWSKKIGLIEPQKKFFENCLAMNATKILDRGMRKVDFKTDCFGRPNQVVKDAIMETETATKTEILKGGNLNFANAETSIKRKSVVFELEKVKNIESDREIR
ncbi:MAG: hypothetical protein J6K39_01220 [Clostridia bacterium]|nr:hypothetical protein [Clostridia bacterium]